MKWTERVLECEDDYEGRVIATIISHRQDQHSKAILYLHGFIDYFFHDHVASFLTEHGWNFYALDLRKYGRSILDHQTPNYCQDLKEYFEEIDQALEIIKEEANEKVVLLGHSMGGLISTHYSHLGKHKGHIDGLILNAPFLDFYNPKILKWIIPSLTSFLSKLFPFANEKKAVSPLYPKSLHKDHLGEWSFDLEKKPIKGFPAYFSWIPAIRRVQQWIYKASKLTIPILVLHGDRSMKPKKSWKEEYRSADIVLNVEHMKIHGSKLSTDVTLKEIKDGMHDVFLSRKAVRDRALQETSVWLNQF